MRTLTWLVSLTFALALLVVGPASARAQEETAGAAGSQTTATREVAIRLFKAIAAGDVATAAQDTLPRYIRKMTAAKLRPPATGVKLTGAFDGNVTIVRSSADDAVVEANIFSPESSDVPAREVSRVRIFLMKQQGEWKASAADKKQAQDDSDINGGWYHAAFFTFCPNRGLIFVPNHFSREIKCQMVAQCRF